MVDVKAHWADDHVRSGCLSVVPRRTAKSFQVHGAGIHHRMQAVVNGHPDLNQRPPMHAGKVRKARARHAADTHSESSRLFSVP